MTVQAFVLTMEDRTKFLTRNWTMHMNEQGSLSMTLALSGDFVVYVNNQRTGGWVASLDGNSGFHVMPADDQEVALLTKAEDTRRIERLAGHLIGLTENLIDNHLPEEFKKILERTPEVVGTLSNLMNEGIKKALDKLGKGK